MSLKLYNRFKFNCVHIEVTPITLGASISSIVHSMGSRPHSTRRHAWHVQPVSPVTGAALYSPIGSRHTVLCGHLFNAQAERHALGLSIGEGEQCCITLEPIADATLSFAETVTVSRFHRNLTGVELLCGHRFSAVNLLWHWCMSPMICPICRAPYAPHRLLMGKEDLIPGSLIVPVSSAVENFPVAYWGQLVGIITENARERALLAQQENRRSIVDALMADVVDTVFAPSQDYFLLLSFVGVGWVNTRHSVRMRRNTTNETVVVDGVMRFSIQRAATRYLSGLIHSAETLSRSIETPCYMTATVVVGIGVDTTNMTMLLPVAVFPDVILPFSQTNGVVTMSVPPSNAINEWTDATLSETPINVTNTSTNINHLTDPTLSETPINVTNSSTDADLGGASVSTTIPILGPSNSSDIRNMSLVSTDTTSQMRLELFRLPGAINSSLASLTVRLQTSDVLTMVAHEVVVGGSSVGRFTGQDTA